jgi:hypothetical protein
VVLMRRAGLESSFSMSFNLKFHCIPSLAYNTSTRLDELFVTQAKAFTSRVLVVSSDAKHWNSGIHQAYKFYFTNCVP